MVVRKTVRSRSVGIHACTGLGTQLTVQGTIDESHVDAKELHDGFAREQSERTDERFRDDAFPAD